MTPSEFCEVVARALFSMFIVFFLSMLALNCLGLCHMMLKKFGIFAIAVPLAIASVIIFIFNVVYM